MSNIKRSILALVLLTGIVTVGCEEDGSLTPTQREPYNPQAPAESPAPNPEPGFVVPSGIGQPDNTGGSGGDNREGYPSQKYDSDSSTNSLF